MDLNRVVGSGENGRITREDVLQVVRQSSGPSSVDSATVAQTVAEVESKPADDRPATPGTAGADNWGPVTFEKTSKIRKTIARKMSESWSTVPRVTNFDDADVTELEAIRQTSKADYKSKGIKLTSMPFIIKSVAMALRQNPMINASLDLENEQVIYKNYVNI